MKGKYLITTDNWFYGPYGRLYRAAWGEVVILGDNTLGVKTNARSSNWYAMIGTEENNIIIAGCQIHYVIRTDEKPDKDKSIDDERVEGGEVKQISKLTDIYIID